jgi:hypothetical protein
MKKIVFLIGLLILPMVTYSQSEQQTPDKKTEKEIQKEKKKAEKKAAEDSVKRVITLMVENHRFVLEADYVAGRTGERIPVNSTLNFIIVDSAKAVIQLGRSTGVGSNGVGGITVDGTVSRYEFTKKENKNGVSFTITLYVNTSLGTYDIVLWVSQNGNTSATVRGNTSGQLNYTGTMVPLGLSRIYKGHSYP